MDRRDRSPQLTRRQVLGRAAALAGAYVLARGLQPVARATPAQAGWWTTAQGKLAADPGGVLVYLPVGLSEGTRLLEGLAKVLADEPIFEPGALPLRDTELWIVGAEVATLSAAEGKVTVELVPGPAYHFIALPTASFYPYPIWDDGANIVTMELTTGEPYEQVVPATYGVAFASVATAFELVERGSGTVLGTISYTLPEQTVEGASALPAEG